MHFYYISKRMRTLHHFLQLACKIMVSVFIVYYSEKFNWVFDCSLGQFDVVLFGLPSYPYPIHIFVYDSQNVKNDGSNDYLKPVCAHKFNRKINLRHYHISNSFSPGCPYKFRFFFFNVHLFQNFNKIL